MKYDEITTSTFSVSQQEILRLLCAYVAIREPRIRAEFLRTVEAWAQDQFHATDDIGEQQSSGMNEIRGNGG